jgi:serine/threonine-protein kinase
MAHRAVEVGRGSTVQEYRDVLGRPVLGAWTWLPEWGMGVGSEQDLDRVLAPMKAVRASLPLVLIAPVMAMVLLASALRLRPLTRGRDTDFGSYHLEYSLGKGGSAEVFLARHEVLKRPAAVKILNTPNPDAATVANFEREARLASSLGHPNTIQIFDYGETPQGKLYYAMEYVKGVNLAQLLAIEGPLPAARALYLLRQVAGALEEAHTLGLVHRDLKPSNVMVCSRGALGDVVKVLDFGIACPSSSAHEDFTGSTELVGTPVYMAPERIRVPSGIDPRSDIYSFGALGFHLLTGRNVFEGPGPTELIYQVLTADRPSPSRFRGEALPEALERLILECLSIDPEERPATFKEVMRRLAAVPAPGRWSQDEARDWWATNRDRLVAFIESVEIARRGA